MQVKNISDLQKESSSAQDKTVVSGNKNSGQMGSTAGQVSIEYLVMVAFLLVVVAVLSVYSFSYLGQTVSIQKAQNATDKIANAANSVAALGSGSTAIIQVEFPSGVQSASITGRQITLTIQTGAGLNSVSSYTDANISQTSLSTQAGFHNLSIASSDSNVVVTEV